MIKIPELNCAVRKLLAFSPLQYMFELWTENPQLAKIYVDDEKEVKCCALLLGHYLFLSNVDEKFIGELYEAAFPKEKQEALGALIVFYDSDLTAELFKEPFKKFIVICEACTNAVMLRRLLINRKRFFLLRKNY